MSTAPVPHDETIPPDIEKMRRVLWESFNIPEMYRHTAPSYNNLRSVVKQMKTYMDEDKANVDVHYNKEVPHKDIPDLLQKLKK